jgi:phage-related protein
LAIADHTVIYDAAAAQELVVAVKSKEGRRAIFNAIDKLEALGEQLAPPHMKPLGGEGAAGLRELRPRQGRSDWRPVYTRIGERAYVILAVGKHDEFEKLLARARARARQYGVWRT